MKQYTKEQLVAAQIKWNKNAKDNPEHFQQLENFLATPEQSATEQIDYLLSLVDEEL